MANGTDITIESEALYSLSSVGSASMGFEEDEVSGSERTKAEDEQNSKSLSDADELRAVSARGTESISLNHNAGELLVENIPKCSILSLLT